MNREYLKEDSKRVLFILLKKETLKYRVIILLEWANHPHPHHHHYIH